MILNPQPRRAMRKKTVGFIEAFWIGFCEFDSSITTHYEDDELLAYDYGRDFAHVLTYRRFEP